MRKLALFIVAACACWANVCVPLSAPANGTHGAVTGGVDALDWGQARIQWYSDAGGTIGSFSISNGGSGYVVNDTGTVFGSTTSPATYTVTSVSGGSVTGVSLSANNGYAVDGNGGYSSHAHPGYAGGSQPGVGQGLVFNITSVTGLVTATQQALFYATAANWGGTAVQGSYPYQQGIQSLPSTFGQVTDSATIQGWTLTNLAPSTVYHVLPQSFQGGSWCTASDIMFTTPARPAVIPLPLLPAAVNVAAPSMTGTHWIYGSNCGTSGTATQKWQNCVNGMVNGDDLAVAPAVYGNTGILIPTNSSAVTITANISTSVFTQSGSAPANNTQVILGSPPSPINPGVPYYIVSSSGSTFQLSLTLGGSAIALAAQPATSPMQYLTYPVALDKTIHPTTSAALLPPAGVRVGPDTLAQYAPNMITLEQDDIGSASFQFAQLAGGWYFSGINFTTDASLASLPNAQFDPPAFGPDPGGLSTGVAIDQNETVSSVVYNQCAVNPAPAPSRSVSAFFDGSNVAFINGFANFEFWQPLLVAPTVTTSSTVITVPSFDYYYVGAGGTVGTKQDCHYTGGSLTVTGGSATTTGGANLLWVDSGCGLNAQLVTGMTATGTNLTVQAPTATPAFPRYSYTTPLGNTIHPYSVLPFSAFDLTAGAITGFAGFGSSGISSQHFESSSGFYSGYGPGPKFFDNNWETGGGIVGVFNAEDSTTASSPCGRINACAEVFNQGNFTETRNRVLMNPCFFPDNPCWNGGAYWPRQGTEGKKMYKALQDGNIYGPYYVGVGQGQCSLHEAFNPQSVPVFGGYPSYVDSSEWTFRYNTCLQTGAGISDQLYYYAAFPAMPLKNLLWHDNLFLNANGYAASSTIAPAGYNFQKSNAVSGCPAGYLLQQGTGENFTFDHNTVSGQGGCLSLWEYILTNWAGGVTRTNNIYNIVIDPGTHNNVLYGTNYEQNAGSLDTPNCVSSLTGFYGAALFNCPPVNTYNLANNVMLATWTNSFPGSQTDYTTGQIATLQTGLGTYATGNFFPSNNTLASRQGQVGWFSVSAANFRLVSSSPYISGGANPALDKTDEGADIDQLEAHQGRVSNVRAYGVTSTAATVAWYGPDSYVCGVQYGVTPFWTGTGSWTSVAGTASTDDARVQHATITGVTAHSLVYVEIPCQVEQKFLTIQLP